jgi:uncharacterized protein
MVNRQEVQTLLSDLNNTNKERSAVLRSINKRLRRLQDNEIDDGVVIDSRPSN